MINLTKNIKCNSNGAVGQDHQTQPPRRRALRVCSRIIFSTVPRSHRI